MSREYENKENDGCAWNGAKYRGSSTSELDWGDMSDDCEFSDSDDDGFGEFNEDDEKRLQHLSETLMSLSTSISALREENASLSKLIISAHRETLELSCMRLGVKSSVSTTCIARSPADLDSRPRKRARRVSIDNKDGESNSEIEK
jgi:hypothetical protein